MKCRAFTLVEVLIGTAVSSVIAVAIFALTNAGMILSAKNLSLNLTSNSIRTALDRVEQVVQVGDTMPTLINTTGADVASGLAAGIKFDRAVGGPFVITAPVGGLPAATTTLTMTRSTHAVASPPAPRVGDIVKIATATGLRPRIQSLTTGTVDAQLRQPFTATLAATLGTAVPLTAGTIMSANLVRNVAFISMPSNGRQELRYYDSFDTTVSLNDATKYIVVTDQMGVTAPDTTPFSLVMIEDKSFVNFSLRVRASSNANAIRGRERDQFNTYSRTDTQIRPKTLP